jgi:protoheme IX farnesyltransferase
MSATVARVEPSIAGVGDYIALMKPRVMSLVVFTALVGLLVAPGQLHPVIGFAALLCIAVGAGAAGALNMWYDADIDARMARTAARPIPRGRITCGEAVGFGLTLAVFSVVLLGLLVNVLAAALLAFTIFFYVAIYTVWLKRSTPQNIVIGGAAGALPPIIGWTAASGSLAIEPILLFMIIFFWTPPHFWALSLYRREDYARAGVPMLPVVAGEQETRRQILLYTLILAPLGATPWLLGYAGLVYGITAAAMGAIMIALALRERKERVRYNASKRLFAFSILYLFLLFAMLLVDRISEGLFGNFGGMTMSEIMEVADNPEGTSIKPAREPDQPLAESAAAEASGHI